MPDGPLDKPAHLRPATETPRGYLAARPLAAATAVLGLISFVVVAASQGALWQTPDWRISVPGFALTTLAAGGSIARRERGGYPLWMIGLGLAGAALVLGWFLMIAVVIAATAILMLILHTVM